MQDEIEEVILSRTNISPSKLEYGNLIFLKREESKYPLTKLKGPFIFVGYGNVDKTTVVAIDPKSGNIKIVNITKVSPLWLY